VPKGYTTRQMVGDELGLVLTGVQEVQVDLLITQAEDALDDLAADRWGETSPVTLEPHTPTGRYVELLNRPVTAVSLVRVRPRSVGATPVTLVAGTNYELLDAARGTLLVPGYTGQWLEVSYTFNAPVPAAIQRAATILVAEWFRPRLLGSTGQITDTVTVGDVSIKYAAAQASTSSASAGVPQRVLDLVAQARRPIFV
jgi:hypothetical protein